MSAYYKITEVAKKLDIKSNTIYKWINDDFKLDIKKNKSNHLIFSDNDVSLIKQIKEYRLQGLSIEAIKDKLNSYESSIKVSSNFHESSIDVLVLNEVTNIENRITEAFNNKFQSLIELSNTIAATSQQLGMLQAENTFIKDLSKLDKNKILELEEKITLSNVQNVQFEKKLEETILRYEETIKVLSNQLDTKDKVIETQQQKILELSNELEKTKAKKKWYQLG